MVAAPIRCCCVRLGLFLHGSAWISTHQDHHSLEDGLRLRRNVVFLDLPGTLLKPTLGMDQDPVVVVDQPSHGSVKISSRSSGLSSLLGRPSIRTNSVDILICQDRLGLRFQPPQGLPRLPDIFTLDPMGTDQGWNLVPAGSVTIAHCTALIQLICSIQWSGLVLNRQPGSFTQLGRYLHWSFGHLSQVHIWVHYPAYGWRSAEMR